MNAGNVCTAHATRLFLTLATRATLFTFIGRPRGIGILARDFIAGGYTKLKHWRISWFPDGDR
jgi:hypothetical protein